MMSGDATNAALPRDEFPAPRGLTLEPAGLAVSGTLVLSFSLEAPDADASHWQPITASERAVMLQLLDGVSNRRIAALRGTSERTVANQVSSIFRKVGVRSRLDLAVVAARRRA